MPYDGETSGKASHSDIVQNPDVQTFLEQCEYQTEPSDDEVEEIASTFRQAPSTSEVELPQQVISVDGSLYESSIDDRLPSTKVGYVKIGLVLFPMDQYKGLKEGRFVNPYKVAQLKEDSGSITFPLPSANITWNDADSVRNGFRAAVDQALSDSRTRWVGDDRKTSLQTTLFHLASRRSGELGTNDHGHLKLHKCPSCVEDEAIDEVETSVDVYDNGEEQHCPNCGGRIYPSDCLRLWEEVNENQSNRGALMRFMRVLEHLMVIHCIRLMRDVVPSPEDLATTVFFTDGPLAVYGTSAWLHLSIMQYLNEVNTDLRERGLPPVLIIGLQKSGRVADHADLIDSHLSPNSLYAIEDDYRYNYITPSRKPSQTGFGDETYYGQDFIYKTSSGSCFVLAVPYPFASKKDVDNFHEIKTEVDRYPELPRALKVVEHFESSLHKNAVVPIALAHEHTAISLEPGGKVLDILTEDALES